MSESPLTNLDGSYTADALEYGRWLFAQSCDFIRGVQMLADLVDFEVPEIAFAGRSNVGKSSLINALTGRKTLARTSNTPGRTQQLNFFDLGGRLYLVDMPGYGYAEVPKTVVAEWRKLIDVYLRGRPTLQRAYVLLDSRVDIKKHDIEIMAQLDKAAVSYQIVLTKCDKVGVTQLQQIKSQVEALLQKHPAAHPKVMATSSAKGMGIEELRAEIAHFGRL
ncbi:ribosome biogenesis GTP-binding protein YihA/YsxC [Candidatus Odyssella acanthamoebae]|uniref:Probable GTP-binding protein EngB n=1 Tax=Candidatus Odyssella acanthamoebae TaxID=91604 RepID=A0A077AWS2_9PROT|nr:ribosome biogenesis GTP-binding protein YihA/YsxC [Candidatus Paracaedibacter acanthamoebae]AIK96926.1 GTP-binding protein [Candidatus Paracaedibacter acanthamoebae]